MRLVRPDAYLSVGWFPLPEVQTTAIAAPEFLRGLRLLFVSDVHLRSCVSDERLDRLMERIRSQKADLILLGGDYAEDAGSCARFFRALVGVPAPMGKFAVAGNNDRECFPDIGDLRKLAESGGAQLLVNEEVRLDGLAVAGCDEYKYGAPQTQGLLSGGQYRILISHFPVKPECDCDLMLSGHTHGGQFNLLGLTPYVTGFERSYRIEAVSGLHKGRMLVSKGIGVSKLPLRIGVRPQIELVKFTG